MDFSSNELAREAEAGGGVAGFCPSTKGLDSVVPRCVGDHSVLHPFCVITACVSHTCYAYINISTSFESFGMFYGPQTSSSVLWNIYGTLSQVLCILDVIFISPHSFLILSLFLVPNLAKCFQTLSPQNKQNNKKSYFTDAFICFYSLSDLFIL